MAKNMIVKCNGKKLEITPVTAEIGNDQGLENRESKAPGHGVIEFSEPQLTPATINPGQSVKCSVMVKGRNIAHISSEVMLKIGKKLIGPICSSYLHSPEDREIKGVLRPRWSDENEVEFDIVPSMKLLYCGERFTLACLQPDNYVTDPEAQIWSIEGVYQRGGGEPFRARLEFDNQGSLIKKIGFYPASAKGLVSPFELFIEEGDTFEPYVSVLSLTGEESLATVHPLLLGGGHQLQWKNTEINEGTYMVGVSVTDFDGQVYRKYSTFKIDQQ